MRTLFVFAALLALVAAQCNVEGNTYESATYSVTFGALVGEAVPALHNMGDVNNVHFATWMQATNTRWEVQEFGSTADGEFCNLKGQYNVDFSGDCSEITFSVISDSCRDRVAFLTGTFTEVNRAVNGDCVSTGTQHTTRLEATSASPRLSEEHATFVFGNDEFAIVSVGTQAALFQRWRLGRDGDMTTSTIVDLGSIPTGFSCNSVKVGNYITNFGENCQARLCGVTDTCEERAQLFHGAALNGFEGGECGTDVETPGVVSTACSPDGRQWLKHPWDCVDQEVDGGCMYCRGVARGETVSLCMEREGAGCNQIFDSTARKTFCNLEFECPASTTAASLMVLVVAVLALFIH